MIARDMKIGERLPRKHMCDTAIAKREQIYNKRYSTIFALVSASQSSPERVSRQKW